MKNGGKDTFRILNILERLEKKSYKVRELWVIRENREKCEKIYNLFSFLYEKVLCSLKYVVVENENEDERERERG
jgi:hypothetical protein